MPHLSPVSKQQDGGMPATHAPITRKTYTSFMIASIFATCTRSLSSSGAESWVKVFSLLDRLPILLNNKSIFSEKSSL
jgi:hypothetical protein